MALFIVRDNDCAAIKPAAIKMQQSLSTARQKNAGQVGIFEDQWPLPPSGGDDHLLCPQSDQTFATLNPDIVSFIAAECDRRIDDAHTCVCCDFRKQIIQT